MNFVKTEWHEKTPNHWCAVQNETHLLIDIDPSLHDLAARMKARGIDDFAYTKNWWRPIPQVIADKIDDKGMLAPPYSSALQLLWEGKGWDKKAKEILAIMTKAEYEVSRQKTIK